MIGGGFSIIGPAPWCRSWCRLIEAARSTAENWWRRRESNPRPKALAFLALHACPVFCRHPAGRTRAPFPPDHPRMNLVFRRRGATEDQPTFLTGLAGAL